MAPFKRYVGSSMFSRLALGILSLASGTLAFLALVSRSYGFWMLSRWPRLLVLGGGALVCSLLVGLLVWAAWSWLARPPRAPKLVWLVVAFAAAVLLRLAMGWAPPAVPALFTLEIATPGSAAQPAGPVVFIELHDPSGRVVQPYDFSMEGDWQRSAAGWTARSDQPARIRYSFYASQSGRLQALFGEQPGAGMLQVTLAGKTFQVDLSSVAPGHRLLDFPFELKSRWDKILTLADLALAGFALPLVLLVLPVYALAGAAWAWPGLVSGARALVGKFDYQKLFIALFLGLSLLPFLDYKGDLSTIDRFFGGNNRFWVAYSLVRYRVFHDRFLGNTLVGKNDWLILTNERSLEDYQNTMPFSEDELFQIQQKIDGTTLSMKEKGITFLVVIPPNKNTIYPDLMPSEIPVLGKESRLDQVIAYQKAHGKTQILDLRPALVEARKDHPVYYRTDTHWNSYGAHAAYVQILNVLQKDYPALKPHALDEYRYHPSGDLLGDLALHWAQGAQREEFFSLAPLFPRQVYKWDMRQGQLVYSSKYNSLGGSLPTAVVYCDSFMDWLEPFLSDHFSKALYIRPLSNEIGMDGNLIEREKPNIVIYEITERLIYRLLLLPTYNLPGE